jgi:hypothetical protein
LNEPTVLLKRALYPEAVLVVPVVLLPRALTPLAVLSSPVALLARALAPLAVLKTPVVLLKRALNPNALSAVPVVLLASAPVPNAVFWAMAVAVPYKRAQQKRTEEKSDCPGESFQSWLWRYHRLNCWVRAREQIASLR